MSRPPINTRQLLNDLDVKPSRKLGQNFLIDANIAAKSIALAEIHEGDTAVEIGPGLGMLTETLIEANATVYAVEIDSRLAEALRCRYADVPRFHLLEDDAVEHPLASMPDDSRDFSIIANLPYSITTPWLDAMLTTQRFPKRMVLMLQKEAAQRITAPNSCKQFSAITIFLNAVFNPSRQHPVSRKCFHPWPDVDSVLLQLNLKPEPHLFHHKTKSLIRDIFTKRRKQIGGISRNHKQSALLANWIEHTKHDGDMAKCRPEELPLDIWIALDEIVKISKD